MEVKAVYFEQSDIENTDAVLNIVNNRIKELGIKTVVLPSYIGLENQSWVVSRRLVLQQ